VVFARWLATSPRLLLLDERRAVWMSCQDGNSPPGEGGRRCRAAVLLVSSELEELTRVCNRYLIMVRGSIVSELPQTAPTTSS